MKGVRRDDGDHSVWWQRTYRKLARGYVRVQGKWQTRRAETVNRVAFSSYPNVLCATVAGRAEDAQRAYTECVAQWPGSFEARANFAMFLQQSGRAAEAVGQFKVGGRDILDMGRSILRQ